MITCDLGDGEAVVYAVNKTREALEDLRSLRAVLNVPVLVGGDWNLLDGGPCRSRVILLKEFWMRRNPRSTQRRRSNIERRFWFFRPLGVSMNLKDEPLLGRVAEKSPIGT
jgi:hypothetical protein